MLAMLMSMRWEKTLDGLMSVTLAQVTRVAVGSKNESLKHSDMLTVSK